MFLILAAANLPFTEQRMRQAMRSMKSSVAVDFCHKLTNPKHIACTSSVYRKPPSLYRYNSCPQLTTPGTIWHRWSKAGEQI